MSLRRYIALIFMTLASAILLGHSAVPHYHHDGIVCMSTDKGLCHTCLIYGDDEVCTHEETAHHNHVDDCDLKDTVLRDSDPAKDVLKSMNVDLLVAICTLKCHDLLTLNDVEIYRLERYNPYIHNFYTSYIGASSGMRAPPVRIFS